MQGKRELPKTVAIPVNLNEAKDLAQRQAQLAKEKAERDSTVQFKEPGEIRETPFDKAIFGAFVEELIIKYKQQKRHLEGSLLKQPYKVDGNKIRFFMNGELQQHRFMQLKPELIGLVRKKLNNDLIEIDLEVKEDAVSEEEKLYTSTDKLAYLTKKSPALKELTKRFGLETDF
ncbi:hypothetical protein GCM10007049_37070 [Echinicola pacifica]|uniref:DNA polymerase-3 subunit gamma/tau n=1 Tax=Echinicola pacifica TaxID=346377 RepID=A0A918UXK7_9BACT|nr:hypothetical protein [Echinicola pacifica]GGZ40230.1 hypothetical protein GCM10007049_37070 [Echinicola pacifica]